MTIKYSELNVGDELPSVDKGEVTQLQLVRYAGASGDFNPIHTDAEYARSFGLDGTIAHGMLVMGMLGQVVSNWVGTKYVKSYKVAFKGMTLPGENIICKGKVKRKKEAEGENLVTVALSAENDKGEVKVSGEAVVSLPA